MLWRECWLIGAGECVVAVDDLSDWSAGSVARSEKLLKYSHMQGWFPDVMDDVNMLGTASGLPVWFDDVFGELVPDYFGTVHRRVVAFFVLQAEHWGLQESVSVGYYWLKVINDPSLSADMSFLLRLGIPDEQVRECIRVFFSLLPDLVEMDFLPDEGSWTG